MTKLESIFSMLTWGLLNALTLAVAFDSAPRIDGGASAPPMHIASDRQTA